MTPKEAFFTLHCDLPREGPGSREDLDWAVEKANLLGDARIFDAGCGPGADIEGLLAHAPKGNITAVDAHPPFVEAVRARWGEDRRVKAIEGNMRDIEGPFDFVWSAGAVYFLGVETGLPLLGSKLAPGGSIAFSDLVYLDPDPDLTLRTYLDSEVPFMRTHADLAKTIDNLGIQSLGQRVLPNSSWEEYYAPMEKRIAKLRPSADSTLTDVLDAGETEIAMWRQYSDQFGYVLSVVRPV
ncbi:MAG: class I SAM-dependent methyltransferase [Boseongicola sp.]